MMKYDDFKQAVVGFPLISSSQMGVLTPKPKVLRVQQTKWHKQGKLWRLKRGLFLLNPKEHPHFPSKEYVACQMLSPSYISMEYALFYYGVIPEFVADLTCITSKKTQRYKNKMGTFIYQHITPRAFTGFSTVKNEQGLSYFMAELEKALVDFFYLNLKTFKNAEPDIFEASYRMRLTLPLRKKKLRAYAGLFQNSSLDKVVALYLKVVEVAHVWPDKGLCW